MGVKANNTGMLCKKKLGAPSKGLSLQEKLASHGVDTVAMLAELLVNPDTSDRIKADILKDIVNYQYAKKKSVQIEDVNGQPITFNLKLTS